MNIWQKLCIVLSLIVSIFILIVILFVCIYFKRNDNLNNSVKNKFEIIDMYSKNNISFIEIYDTKSKVLYLIIESANKFAITPIFDSDGSLQLYNNLN